MNAPVRTDIAAKQTLDRLSRAVREQDGALALEAGAMLQELQRLGYVLLQLEPDAEVGRPVRLRSKYEGECSTCGEPIAVGEVIWWRRGVQGIDCLTCGGKS